MSDFEERLRLFYRDAKGAKRKAAEFLMRHADQAAFMTLEQVAEKAGVSAATVARTAAGMGYDGYPGLLKAARRQIRRDMAPVERLIRTGMQGGGDGFARSLEADMAGISRLGSMNSPERISQTLALLAESARIFLFSSRTSYGPLSFFAYALSQIRPGVTLLTEAEGRLMDQLMDIGPGDAVFLADMPRYSRIVVQCAAVLQDRGCRIIALTDGAESPMAQYAHVMLCVPYASASFFNTGVPALAMYNALAAELNIRMQETSLPRLQRHNALMRSMGTLMIQGEDEK